MHSAEMKLSPAELQDITNAMLDLLEDQLVMCNIQEAQEAASSIKEVIYYNLIFAVVMSVVNMPKPYPSHRANS